jgi:hypothetical protein
LSAQQEQNDELETSAFVKMLGLQEPDLSKQLEAQPAEPSTPAR